ncbi:MAG: sodium:proton antiporter [Steroidobacteraceae bacterium]
MTSSVAPWAVLLLVAAVVGVFARRLHVPYSVGLVVAGIGLALLPWHPSITLSRELVYTGILPPLIFEAAFELRWAALRRNLALVVVLATVGVLLSALVTGAVMTGLVHWPMSAGLLFGIVMAATDAVSVLATLKEIGARGRLALLLEAESLLNDGTAAVLFAIAIGFVAGEPLTYTAVATTLWTTIVIGLLAGAIVAGIVFALIGRTDDHLLEVALTTVAAYGSFLLAEQFGGSGILATLTAGMLLGNLATRWGFFSEAGDRTVRSTWEFITFLANSLVFLLIGLAEGHEDLRGLWWTAGGAVIAVLAGRTAAVYPVCALFSRGPNRVDVTQQHALVWGGLRGALGLALVLSIPESFPWRHPIVVVTFAVVAFSIIVQGLTCRPLLRRACRTDAPRKAGADTEFVARS